MHIHTFMYFICIIYTKTYKSDDVVTLNPSLTDCLLKVYLKKIQIQTSFQTFVF